MPAFRNLKAVVFGLDETLSPRLPGLDDRGGGSTRIDITRNDIDKAYGIRKLQAQLGLSLDEMLFIGERLDETGNDYPVYALGIASVSIEDWWETLAGVTAFNASRDDPDAEFALTVLSSLR